MQKENMEQAKSGGGMPRGELLPYRAPWIEMNVVKLEGGIATGSARLKYSSSKQWKINDYEDQSVNTGDVELL